MYTRQRGATWSYTISLGRDPQTGQLRQLTKGGFATKDLAEQAGRKAEVERDEGFDLRPDRTTLKAYLMAWLDRYARDGVAPSTYERYEELLRKHVYPTIGAVRIRALRRDKVAQMETLARRTVSPTTVLHIHRVLHEALRHAVQWDVISRNPMEGMAAPKAAHFAAPVLSVEDVWRIEDAADANGIGGLVRMAIRTGARQGELFALTWRDIDFGVGTAYINKSKSRAGQRPLALDADTLEMLQQARWQQLRDHPAAELVFLTPKGEPWTQEKFRGRWEAVRRVVGMPKLREHDLRHGHATFLFHVGASPKIAQERLGHASPAITLGIYAHVMADAQREAANNVGKLLRRPE